MDRHDVGGSPRSYPLVQEKVVAWHSSARQLVRDGVFCNPRGIFYISIGLIKSAVLKCKFYIQVSEPKGEAVAEYN